MTVESRCKAPSLVHQDHLLVQLIGESAMPYSGQSMCKGLMGIHIGWCASSLAGCFPNNGEQMRTLQRTPSSTVPQASQFEAPHTVVASYVLEVGLVERVQVQVLLGLCIPQAEVPRGEGLVARDGDVHRHREHLAAT